MSTKHIRPRTLTAVLTLTAILGGCMSTQPRWEPPTLTSVTEATSTELVLQGNGPLGKAEMNALQNFQRQHRPAPGERLLLAYPPARRDAAITAAGWLAARGLAAVLREDPVLPADSLHLGVWRTRVAVPECGVWSDASRSDFNNQPWPDFGCASLRNTALMVADPADLTNPGGLGPGSGEEAAGAIERHRSFHDESSSGSPIAINLGGSGDAGSEQ